MKFCWLLYLSLLFSVHRQATGQPGPKAPFHRIKYNPLLVCKCSSLSLPSCDRKFLVVVAVRSNFQLIAQCYLLPLPYSYAESDLESSLETYIPRLVSGCPHPTGD